MLRRFVSLASFVVFLVIQATFVVVIEAQEEITSPVCRQIKRNSLSFCSMVDYMAVVDEKDPDGQKANEKAQTYHDNMNILLLRFSCSAKYSLYTCDDCRDAYKYWICSVMFQKCGDSPSGPTATLCAPDSTCKDKKEPPLNSKCCDESVDGKGRQKTCLSLCEDVVRKCPYVLNFQCPTTETMFFSNDLEVCNKMDRTTNPDRPDQPWPGTFA